MAWEQREGDGDRKREKRQSVCVLRANGAVPFRKKKVWKRRKTADL